MKPTLIRASSKVCLRDTYISPMCLSCPNPLCPEPVLRGRGTQGVVGRKNSSPRAHLSEGGRRRALLPLPLGDPPHTSRLPPGSTPLSPSCALIPWGFEPACSRIPLPLSRTNPQPCLLWPLVDMHRTATPESPSKHAPAEPNQGDALLEPSMLFGLFGAKIFTFLCFVVFCFLVFFG